MDFYGGPKCRAAGLYMYVDTRRTPRFARLTALLVFSSLACDDSAGLERIDTVRAPIVGTPASMLRGGDDTGRRVVVAERLRVPTDTGEEIAVVARGYEFTGDYLAIDGAARESERSSFILKGDGQDIYGWLVLPDRDLAFEYTTSPQGNVIVQRVPITKIYPVCNDGPPEADAPFFEPVTPTAAAAGDPRTSVTTTARTPTSCRADRGRRRCCSWTSQRSRSPRPSCGAPGRSSRGRTPRSRSTSRPMPRCTRPQRREIGARPASATRTDVRPAP